MGEFFPFGTSEMDRPDQMLWGPWIHRRLPHLPQDVQQIFGAALKKARQPRQAPTGGTGGWRHRAKTGGGTGHGLLGDTHHIRSMKRSMGPRSMLTKPSLHPVVASPLEIYGTCGRSGARWSAPIVERPALVTRCLQALSSFVGSSESRTW